MRNLYTLIIAALCAGAVCPAARADLLATAFDDTGGLTVLRYDENTFDPVAGTVATGDHGLGMAQGVAVAPDGSFYVSSNGTFTGIMRYSQAGTFLGTLSGPIIAPASLAIGPNGNLYAGDLGAGAIYQFDTTTQDFLPAETLSLGFAPGGFAFAPDVSQDLIVSALDSQSVVRYHADSTSTTLLGPGSGLNVSAILPEPAGTLLLADFDLGFEPFDHHQIVRFDPNAEPGNELSQVVNLTFPLGTDESEGFFPQPTSLLWDDQGRLLIGLSPDHNLNGAILRFDFGEESLTPLVSDIGTPTGLAFIAPVPEPAAWILAAVGGSALVLFARRRAGGNARRGRRRR